MVDFEKFPILYEEETREKVEKFIFENFDSQKETGEENFICHEITSEYVHSDVYFAPEAEQQLTIFDEARVAFANDIKDMLQEFIDMGDIDCEDDEDCEDE